MKEQQVYEIYGQDRFNENKEYSEFNLDITSESIDEALTTATVLLEQSGAKYNRYEFEITRIIKAGKVFTK